MSQLLTISSPPPVLQPVVSVYHFSLWTFDDLSFRAFLLIPAFITQQAKVYPGRGWNIHNTDQKVETKQDLLESFIIMSHNKYRYI